MTQVGCYEVKAQLPQLLERVARGERIVITKHGRVVAMLVPPARADEKSNVREAIRAMKELRKGNRLDGIKVRDLIDEMRRF